MKKILLLLFVAFHAQADSFVRPAQFPNSFGTGERVHTQLWNPLSSDISVIVTGILIEPTCRNFSILGTGRQLFTNAYYNDGGENRGLRSTVDSSETIYSQATLWIEIDEAIPAGKFHNGVNTGHDNYVFIPPTPITLLPGTGIMVRCTDRNTPLLTTFFWSEQ